MKPDRSRTHPPRGILAGAVAGAMVLALAVPQASNTAQAATAAPAAASKSTTLTATEASARAVASGKPVPATAMTTSTREVTANPNGSFTMTISPVPVRKERHGTWVPLDATLHVDADGSISPAAVPGALSLSGGGDGPLATMTSEGHRLALVLPVGLPRPVLSGATATYRNVLPGTDLVVTATDQGGFSDVFVVRTPAAAADPRLANLLAAHLTTSAGLTLHSDASGALYVSDRLGQRVFSAPVPAAWDSATTGTAAAAGKGAKSTAPFRIIPTGSHTPLASTTAQPGRYAHQASLNAALHGNALTLTAPSALKNEASADYPLYYDPSFGPSVTGFASVNSYYSGQPYLNGAGLQGYMQVGYNGSLEGCSPCFNARSFVTLSLTGLPSDAVDISAQVNFWDTWSASCTAEELDLWSTGPISTSSSNPTTWSNQPAWNTKIGSQTVSKGWSSSCPAGGIGYDISGSVGTALSAHSSILTLGLRIPSSQESSNDDNWKQLNGNNSSQSKTTASITYNVKPNTPTGLYTSPATNCSSKSPTTLGDTGVVLYAPVSTSTKANLTTTFTFYKTADSTKTNLLTSANGIAHDYYVGASGTPAVMTLPESFIKAQAGTTAPTTFSWFVTTSDGIVSDPSAPCTFTIDTSRPGSPGVSDAATPPAGSKDCPLVPSAATEPVNTSCAFDFTPPANSTISGYTYQVNGLEPTSVAATGATTVEINLPGMVNYLTVSAVSAGGNVGSSYTVWFDGTAFNPPETDADLTADHTPDLIVPGSTSGAFPPGLWLADGQRNGSVDSYATNIGVSGVGYAGGSAAASDWNGAQAITGDFCGNGAQDVLAYYPGAYNDTTNPHGGGGAIVCGTGTDNPLEVPASGTQYSIGADSFQNTIDGVSNNAAVIGNGGTENDADLGQAVGLMYGIVPTGTGAGLLDVFAQLEPNSVDGSLPLTGLAPPGTDTDWNDWTIATAQDVRGGTTYTDMYLWDATTGDLYLWAGVALNAAGFAEATGLTYTQYQIATGWNTGKTLKLRAADIAGTGNPGLWATNTTTGQTTSYIPPATLAAKPTLTADATTITTATHSWQFSDMPTTASSGDAVTTTADGDGTLPLSQKSTWTGAQWNTGDQFSPDVEFTGKTTAGGLQTASAALDLTKSFTVSFWTVPNADGRMALSQSGSQYPGLMVYPDGTGWGFYLANDNGTASWGGDGIIGGTIDYGVWSKIQANYNATTHVMSLYVDDTLVATGTHAPPSSGATGPLTLGANIDAGSYTSYYDGQIANVQTWSNAALAPNQPSTRASYHQAIQAERILDTRQTATNPNSGVIENNTPVAAHSTTTVPIVGDKVTPVTSGAPTTIPATATAVSVDITAIAETANGNLTVYADGTQQPQTSSTNYATGTTVTGYNVVPIGLDGKIVIYNGSAGTTQLVLDITGYFTSDATLTGDQTYHPLATAYRALNTANSYANTSLTATGPVAAGKSFTLKVSGTTTIPSTDNATAVAINLTAYSNTGLGILEAYQTGASPIPTDTTLTYDNGAAASFIADVPIGTGGTITISNNNSATDIIADISGYFTTDLTGEVYHTVNPTRLVDTRIGIGGTTGAISASGGNYISQPAVANQITTAANPVLALQLTETGSANNGDYVAYPAPSGTPVPPGTSNLNWTGGQTTANLGLIPTGTANTFVVTNQGTSSAQLIVDCSGYFAAY